MMEDVEDIPDDVLFPLGARIKPKPLAPEGGTGAPKELPKAATLLSGPYRGIHRLPAPDADLPYTLDGRVWNMSALFSLYIMWNGAPTQIKAVLSEVKRTIFTFSKRYDSLVASMQDYGQRVPVRITEDNSSLRDGLHRIAIGDILGWETMLADTGNSRWHEWDESQVGQVYHKAWRQI
jgi:hypothetical protein